MNANSLEDQTGISDLSAASIDDVALYHHQPSIGISGQHQHPQEQQPFVLSSTLARINQATSMPSSPRTHHSASFTLTPGQSRITTVHNNTSSAAWTPSPPEVSASRSSIINHSAPRSSPSVQHGNESMGDGSSIATFDFTNASFSESFLRQAGAHMLAGLDEAHSSPSHSSSSSTRFRTSSSPTITVRPIRDPDPQTPFIGKSLRTRMAEAGMLDSPTSSDGSSPSRSPTARVLPESHSNFMHADMSQHVEQNEVGKAHSDSPQVERFTHKASSDHLQTSPFRQTSPWRNATCQDSMDAYSQSGWHGGLSMVPEKSYVEDVSQLHSSPAPLQDASHHSLIKSASPFDQSVSHIEEIRPPTESPPFSSIPSRLTSPVRAAPAASTLAPPSPAESNPILSSSRNPASDRESPQSPEIVDSLACTSPLRKSPQPVAPSPAATPQSPARKLNTPRSFARLHVVTPARSSPLSRVVNFSPSSNEDSSPWQKPASQKSPLDSPSPAIMDVGTLSKLELTERSTSARPEDVQDMPLPRAEPNEVITTAAQTSTTNDKDRQRSEPSQPSFPGTPKDSSTFSKPTEASSPSWSPATSETFATPASQRAPFVWSSASARLACVGTPKQEEAASPPAEFGTPQWTPSPFAVTSLSPETHRDLEKQPEIEPGSEAEEEEEEEEKELSSSVSSSAASEKKQSGEVSIAADTSINKDRSLVKRSESNLPVLSLASDPQHDSSPAAARFSRMQLARINSILSPSPTQISTIPEFGTVATALDSLTNMTETRITRLLAQLSASTTRIEELESLLESRDRDVEDVREALTQLSSEYEVLVEEAETKDRDLGDLVRQLQAQLDDQAKNKSVSQLEKDLDEEKRLREVERRDFEVRLQALMNPSSPVAQSSSVVGEGEKVKINGLDVERLVEMTKDQLRSTMEKDFAIRQAIEQREMQDRICQLEQQLASTPSTAVSAAQDTFTFPFGEGYDGEISELRKQVEQLTADLNRRFEEATDLREELTSLASEKDSALDRVTQLEQARMHPSHQSNNHSREEREEELEEELDKLRSDVVEKEQLVERLEETLNLTNSRLASVTAQHERFVMQHTSHWYRFEINRNKAHRVFTGEL
uniref:Uncharacterized protein n=1 Tax=Melanopsichium pennsylvanicum 4 TaxID=1398559 RepID=A0A077RAC6_9BASI|nr:putative protein [Melanopsichium pennsylvanicum 4]